VLLIIALISGLVSMALGSFVRTYALRHRILDHPNERSSHLAPTPRGGGIAILVATAVGMLLGVAFGTIAEADALILGVGMIALGLVGWIDDLRGLRASIRLAVQFLVAVWTLAALNGIPMLRNPSTAIWIVGVGYVLCAIAIVWSINLFNFMDGIDGLAGSQATIIFGVAAILLFYRGDKSLAALSAVVATSSVGFLVWNWPPAKIFMGDVGSGALGYLIVGLAITSENHGALQLSAFGLLYGVFIVDATVTLIRRLARGHGAIDAHKEHAYQRLTSAWGGHRRFTLAAAAVTLYLALLCTAGTLNPRLMPTLFIAGYVSLLSLLATVERIAPM